MGSYVFYKVVDQDKATEADKWLNEQPEQKRLKEIRDGMWIWTKNDREAEQQRLEETGNGAPNFMSIGEGQFKVSGLPPEHHDEILSLFATLLAQFGQQFEIKVLSQSCGLNLNYFTVEQIRAMTQNGTNLSGDEKERIYEIIGQRSTKTVKTHNTITIKR